VPIDDTERLLLVPIVHGCRCEETLLTPAAPERPLLVLAAAQKLVDDVRDRAVVPR